MEVQDYHLFIEKVERAYGIDLAKYKEAQMKRRLTSLRDKRGFRDFISYFKALEKDISLRDEFFDRITINVTEFFRNPTRWEALSNQILPRILEQNPRPKVWSAACSTGEEPYTLALLLLKFLPLNQINILATDIDENALAKAEKGIYHERTVKDVPKDLLNQYFQRDGEYYRISEEIKKTVHFKKQNLLSESFGGPFDLIVCRNVMIYFTDEAKDILYHKFSAALRPQGVLFVGSTEQIFNPNQYKLRSEVPFFYTKINEN